MRDLVNSGLVIGGLFCAFGVIGCQTPTAEDDFRIGTRLLDAGIEMSGELRDSLGLPKYVVTKEDALKWFLGRAAEANPEEYYGAYYLLGQHFLAGNCYEAEYFLKLYIEIGTDVDPLAEILLTRIEEEGTCEGARSLIMPPSGDSRS